MKMFPSLATDSVSIKCGNSTPFEAKKLSILEFSRIDMIIGRVNKAINSSQLNEEQKSKYIDAARQDIIKVIKPHLAAVPSANLWQLSYEQIVELTMKLSFGSSDPMLAPMAHKSPAMPQKKSPHSLPHPMPLTMSSWLPKSSTPSVATRSIRYLLNRLHGFLLLLN